MIEELTAGLPRTLAEPMRREFASKTRDLGRWAERSRSPRYQPYLSQRKAIEQVIALGIYYRYIVAAFAGFSELHGRLEGSHEATLSVAGHRMTPDLVQEITHAVRDFDGIVSGYGLSKDILCQTSVLELVKALIKSEERARQHEP